MVEWNAVDLFDRALPSHTGSFRAQVAFLGGNIRVLLHLKHGREMLQR
jgi:hypothetical protein